MGTTTTSRGGIKFLSINGAAYDVAGEAKWSVANVKRETLAGEDAVHGYKETPVAPFMQAEIRDGGGLSVSSFNNMTNVTVTMGLRNGKTIVGNALWSTEPQEVDTMDAKFSLRFEGLNGSVVEA